jgi:hypothetical protein
MRDRRPIDFEKGSLMVMPVSASLAAAIYPAIY